MANRNDLLTRWQRWSRDLTHQTLNRVRREAPPAIARPLSDFQKNLRSWERRTDRARAAGERRVREASDGLRRRIAGAIRRLERRVSAA